MNEEASSIPDPWGPARPSVASSTNVHAEVSQTQSHGGCWHFKGPRGSQTPESLSLQPPKNTHHPSMWVLHSGDVVFPNLRDVKHKMKADLGA